MSLVGSPKIALILGSAPDSVRSRDWERSPFGWVVAINNAWAIRTDWDYLIHADDFPTDRLPSTPSGAAATVKSKAFVPAQNAFGGFVYAGGTMAFTAAYWALHTLRPDVLAFLGCDMIYPQTGQTHFYGKGTADPLRQDVTLRSLEAKSSRLFVTALRHGTLCLNLSRLPESRLIFPRITLQFLHRLTAHRLNGLRSGFTRHIQSDAEKSAQSLEGQAGYFVEDGRYWESAAEFSEVVLDQIDRLWMASVADITKSTSSGCWRSRGGA